MCLRNVSAETHFKINTFELASKKNQKSTPDNITIGDCTSVLKNYLISKSSVSLFYPKSTQHKQLLMHKP